MVRIGKCCCEATLRHRLAKTCIIGAYLAIGLFGNVSTESDAECRVVRNESKDGNTRIQISVNTAPTSRPSPTSSRVAQSTQQRRTQSIRGLLTTGWAQSDNSERHEKKKKT